jgi:hypothetical protein
MNPFKKALLDLPRWSDTDVSSFGSLYTLDGIVPARCSNLNEWMVWFENYDRAVCRDEMPDGTLVSTVFLGINHQMGPGLPLLFETMVFGGALDHQQWRYSTWREAEQGHAAVLAAVLNPAAPMP